MKRHRLVKIARTEQGLVALGDGLLAAALLAAAGGAAPPGRALAASAAWLVVLYAMGLYDFDRFRDRRGLERDLCIALSANGLLAAVLLPNAAVIIAAVAAHACFFAWRLAWLRLLSAPWLRQEVAFLGESALIRAMVQDIRAGRHPGYRVAAWRRVERPLATPPALARWAPSGAEIPRLSPRPDLLVIDSALGAEERGFIAAFSLAAAAGLPVIDELEFYEIIYRKIAPRRAATPEWLMSHILPRKRLVYPAVKRAFDAAAAALGLLAASPAMALAAVAVAADGGNVFYRQKRIGLLGREFTIWKFRTMAEGAESTGPLCDAARRASRVTRWGAFLRRFHLDELPQLWNVLLGEMSLVGPRPEWVEEVQLLERSVPCYHFRHLVKPGLTGWAQINFRATNSLDDSVEKLRYDLYYLKHMSPELDLGILLRTIKRAFQPDESFLVHEADSDLGRRLDPNWGGA